MSHRRHRRALVLFLAAAAASPALGDIISTGDVSPTFNTTGNASTPGAVLVGNTAFGQLDLSASSALSSGSYAQIGAAPGSNGVVNLTGSSSWSLPGAMEIGYFSSGSMNITDSATLTPGYARVGTAASGNGSLHIGGTAGALVTTSDFEVGSSGAGSLTLDGSGRIAAGFGTIALFAGSHGNASIASPTASFTTTSGYTVGGDGTGVLSITAGSFTPGWLTIGEMQTVAGGSGAVSLANAASSISTAGEIVVGLSTTGSLAASQNASVAASSLEVARDSVGTFNLDSGAVATASNDVIVGTDAGSSGTASLTGTGTKLTDAGFLEVARGGSGSVSLANGAALSNTSTTLGTNAGSVANVSVLSGSSWTSSDFMTLGDSGNATVSVGGAAKVVSGPVTIGSAAGSTGTASLTGTGTSWTINAAGTTPSDLTIGYQGSGRVDVLDHASVTVASVSVGWTNRGQLNLSGGAQLNITGDVIFAYGPGSTATSNISGAATALANTGFLEVGHSGSASLAVSAGASIADTSAVVAAQPGSSGTVSLDNATWTSSSFMAVGQSGSGSISAANGSHISVASSATIGGSSLGSLTLDGPTTTFTTGDFFEVGRDAQGTLVLQNGAHLSTAGNPFLGSNAGGTGTATLSGAGTLWQSPALFLDGTTGTGSLTVQNGAALSITGTNGSTIGSSFNLANNVGSTGSATFTGAGTTGSFAGNVNVGFRGVGSLVISAGAVVTSQNGFLGRNLTTPTGGGNPVPATGTATITGASSAWRLMGNLWVGGSDTAAGGPGTLNVQSGGSVSMAGSLTVWPTGAVHITSGSLAAGSATVGGTLTATSLSLPAVSVTGAGSVALLAGPVASSVGPLSISGSGTFDLANDPLTTTTAPATIRSYLLNQQLFSSTPNPNHILALGYLTTGSSSLVKLTYSGDANLDGRITGDDYALLDRNYARYLSGAIPAGTATWQQGDFNYDGVINSADYLLLDTTFGKLTGQLPESLLGERLAQFGPAYIAALSVAVPEPASLALVGAWAAGLLCRRRRAR